MSGETQVREHFEAGAQRFDAIYDDAKAPLKRFVDDYWRGVVRERFKLVLERLSPTEGLAVLDVGTGSGRYSWPSRNRVHNGPWESTSPRG